MSDNTTEPEEDFVEGGEVSGTGEAANIESGKIRQSVLDL